MEKEAVKNEFQAILAGAGPRDESSENISTQPRVISSKRLPSGAIVETTQEKSMKFHSKVKAVRVNKNGEYIGDA